MGHEEFINNSFAEYAKNHGLCLDTKLDAWGRDVFAHSHVQALFDGFKAGCIASLPLVVIG